MNNNNRNNNRRRGRNNRGQGGGGQGNRIDSRARGNAPQMLEKYKKLAHDASLNGDRVQTEYYLQFADHYFRVIADTRSQKDEQRSRRDDRERDDFGDDESEFDEAPAQRSGESRSSREADEGRLGSEGERVSQDDEENPFVAESRPRRNNRTRGGRGNGAAERGDEGPAGLDPASLPPAIGADGESGDSDGEEARPRRRARRPREAGDDEALKVVG